MLHPFAGALESNKTNWKLWTTEQGVQLKLFFCLSIILALACVINKESNVLTGMEVTEEDELRGTDELTFGSFWNSHYEYLHLNLSSYFFFC